MGYIKTLPLPPPRCRSVPHQLPPASAVCSGTVIYADRCSIDDDKLSQMGIVFKKIPRDISRL